MTPRLFLAATFALAGVAALAAQPYRTINRLFVVPITQDTFEVIEDRGAAARDMWCAAADYVQAIGRDRPRLRLYVQEVRGPSRTTPNRIGVVYTINPDDTIKDTPPSYSVTVTNLGENLDVGHARNFCDYFIEDVFDRF